MFDFMLHKTNRKYIIYARKQRETRCVTVRGGRREGSGRPRSSIERERHSVSATPEEWSTIEKMVKLVRSDREKCNEVLASLGVNDAMSVEKVVKLPSKSLLPADVRQKGDSCPIAMQKIAEGLHVVIDRRQQGKGVMLRMGLFKNDSYGCSTLVAQTGYVMKPSELILDYENYHIRSVLRS